MAILDGFIKGQRGARDKGLGRRGRVGALGRPAEHMNPPAITSMAMIR